MAWERWVGAIHAGRRLLARWGRAYWARAMARGANLGVWEIPRDAALAESRLERAIELVAAGDTRAAEREVRQALEADLGHADAHRLLGRLLFARDAIDEAWGCFEQAALRSSQPAAVYMEAGELWEDKGHEEVALGLLRRAADLAPRSADIQLALARVHGTLGDRVEARTIVDAVLASEPHNPRAKQARELLE